MPTSKAIRAARKARCRICRQPIYQQAPFEWAHIKGTSYEDDGYRIHDAEPTTMKGTDDGDS